MNEAMQADRPIPNQRLIHFVDHVLASQTALMSFSDPLPRYAVETLSPATGSGDDAFRILVLGSTTVPSQQPGPPLTTTHPAARPPIFIQSGGTTLTWQPGEALLHCAPARSEAFLQAILDFTHYEAELSKLEREIASTWHELEQDKSLVFQVTSADLARSPALGARVDLVLKRRIRHARIEPHLLPDPSLPPTAQKLGRLLRRKANFEGRLETVDGQLQVFEDVYEMGSQRLGEFRASSQEHTLEWVIIVLLAAETLLMCGQALWHFLR